jgi:hypothetical protein
MFCFSFCFTSRQVRNGDDPDAQTSKHKFQTEQKLGKHDLPGCKSNYHAIAATTAPRKIVERVRFDTPNTQIHDQTRKSNVVQTK